MRLLMSLLSLPFLVNIAHAQFQVRDVVISDTSSNLSDPEIDWLGNRIVWADTDGIWVADIDPVTGAFIPAHGKGVLVDSTPSFRGMSLVVNGPEWAMSRDGSEVIYPDSTEEGIGIRIGLAHLEGGRWVQRPLENSANRIPFFASYDADYPHAGITSASVNPQTMKGEGIRLRFTHESSEHSVPDSFNGGRWVLGQRAVSGYRREGRVYEAGFYNTTTRNYEKVLETETEIEQVWVMPLPEIGGLYILWCVEKKPAFDEIAVYAKIGAAWRKVDSLRPPSDRNEIFSPEPFWWEGRSYIFCVARPRQGQPRSLYDQVWILGLDPAIPFARMVSEDSPAVRVDPEVYYTTTEPVIYYTEHRADRRRVIHLCATGLAGESREYDPAPFRPMTFAKDYFPGTHDVNGRFLGSTETMSIVPHKGKLYAGMGNWMDYPWQPDTEGSQILRKDAHNATWVVDTSLGFRSMRTDALKSVVFTKDSDGNALASPDTILVCGAGDISLDRPRELGFWARDDVRGVWRKSIAYTMPRGTAGIRSFQLHTDKVTGREWLFCGLSEGSVIKAAYDPRTPDLFRYDTTQELRGLGRVMAMCVCNGDLYASAGVDIVGADTVGGLYRRIDGPAPSWELVYTWPYIPSATGGDETNIMRGITCVPDPDGSNSDVLIGTRAFPGIVERIDPGNGHAVSTELFMRDFIAAQWDIPFYRGPLLSAYNEFTPDTLDGKRIWWQGLWVEHPDNSRHPHNGSHFLVRYEDGSYNYHAIFDDTHPVPAGERLRACRTICRSPFPEEPRVWYFGGYDCAQDTSKNTSWIYRGYFTGGTSSVERLPHESGLRMFPNPTTSVITIDVSTPRRVKIQDVLGREYWSGSITTTAAVPVAGWPAGFYLVISEREAACFVKR